MTNECYTETMNEQCELCGATGKGTSAWGGWCHDCDNQMSEAGS